MEDLWSSQTLFGMLWFCSSFLSQPKLTQAPRCLISWFWILFELESVGFRILYELDYRKRVLYVIQIKSILGKLPVVPVGDTVKFHTTCATSFQVRPTTADWVPEMDARCSLSTGGHWDGPMISNETGQGIRASVVQQGIMNHKDSLKYRLIAIILMKYINTYILNNRQ